MKYFLITYLVLINCFGFALMFIDKKRAIKKKWRIQERTFFLVALLGGGIGDLFGMYVFHHKTKRLKFVIGIPLIIILELVLFYYISFKL
ncbi:MAG TPA: DUF1294 domain-containing protein [Clostridiaceae bacterium]